MGTRRGLSAETDRVCEGISKAFHLAEPVRVAPEVRERLVGPTTSAICCLVPQTIQIGYSVSPGNETGVRPVFASNAPLCSEL